VLILFFFSLWWPSTRELVILPPASFSVVGDSENRQIRQAGSAKGGDARRQTVKGLACPSGARLAAAVLRVLQKGIRTSQCYKHVCMFLCRFAALSVFVVLSLPAAPRVPQPIWPHGAPEPANTTGTEHDTTKATDNRVAGRPVIRTGDVSNPTLAFYPAPKPNASGATVVVFPGGAYRILALDLEGTEVCEWLNSIGVNAVLVKYRVPQPEGVARYQEPLQDAQRAMGIVRAHSTEWNIDSHHVGVLGFSAGGHLAAALSTNYEKRTYDPIDAADQQSCKPDFTVLVYPGYLVSPAEGPQLSSELVVNHRRHPPSSSRPRMIPFTWKIVCSITSL
jgi:hypothetical protein